MNPDRRPDLNERPANDNRTLDLPDLFERSYSRGPNKPLDPLMRWRLLRVAAALAGLLLMIGNLLFIRTL